MKILVIDNYDSFVYNIVHILRNIPEVTVDVVYNDQVEISTINEYDKILLSPGPGVPKDAGKVNEVIARFADSKPILGVCLGHQAIGESFGATLHNLVHPLHGVQSDLTVLKKDYLFDNLPQSFKVGHYHSWVVQPQLPEQLEAIASDQDSNIMAIRHKFFDVRGLQFHPESILTQNGRQILKNWVRH